MWEIEFRDLKKIVLNATIVQICGLLFNLLK
jgi:hypothetical protein